MSVNVAITAVATRWGAKHTVGKPAPERAIEGILSM